MSTILRTIIVGLILFSNINSYSGTIDPKIPDSEYIDFGKKFECVLQIAGLYKDDSFFLGSCVLIDEEWVLTAAHVVHNQKFSFVFDEDKAIAIDEVFCHDTFDETKNTGDIAICHLHEKIKISVYPALYDKDDENGKTCAIAGYGYTGTFVTGCRISDGKKRAGSNKIDYIVEDLIVCSASEKNKTSMEFLIGHGDSGGGLFINGRLAGINSCVSAVDKKPDSTYNDESGHTRISKFIEWINKKRGKH